ncbi:MAG: tetraacyldisaccharide 4'-kinase [Pseudodesulfovibrio sp.]|nr:tetraacyldisaccharide 4'-kinase [Pseudodesulfovibrio sp.]
MANTITTLQRSFAPILKPLSWLYGFGMRVREVCYARGLFPGWEPPALTVSVGNIGWGGSGKTPVAGWLLGWAESKGFPAVLLTRGYRAKPVSYPYLVPPGALVEEAGDEPLMLAKMYRKAHVVVDPNRTRGGRWIVDKVRPRLVVLDDGFQHMAVKRHLNLVLLRPDDLDEQWNRVIPAGSWREPMAALKRADAFLIKVGPKNFKKLEPFIAERLERFHKPVFSFQVLPTGIRHVLHGNVERDFDGGKYLLVTGVGDPAQVRRTAKAYLGYGPIRHMTFKDHHAYTKRDVLEMQTVARRLGCEAILCTPKDAVKLGPMCTEEFWQFDLRMDFGPSTIGPNTSFDVWWDRRYDAFNLRRTDDLADQAAASVTEDSTMSGDQENSNG